MGIRQTQIAKPFAFEYQSGGDTVYERTQLWLWNPNEKSGPGFVPWLQSGTGVFWIRGKAGSGKSTIMRHIWDSPETESFLSVNPSIEPPFKDWIPICAFFHDRGLTVQKSLTGVLAALVYQLLSQEPALFDTVIPHGFVKPQRYSDRTGQNGHVPMNRASVAPDYGPFLDDTIRLQTQTTSALPNAKTQPERSTTEPIFRWSLTTLKDALRSIITQTSVPLKIFALIDALDEHQVLSGLDEHDQMVEYFKELSSLSSFTVKIKLVMSSRPETVFQDHLGKTSGFYMENYTRPDIVAYIQGRLGLKLGISMSSLENPYRKAAAETSKFPDTLQESSSRKDSSYRRILKLMNDLADKARGVFLWVELVTDELLKEWKANPGVISFLERQLEALPEGLMELYKHLLARVTPENAIASYYAMKLIISFGRRVSVLELVIMVRFCVEYHEPLEQPERCRKRFLDFIGDISELSRTDELYPVVKRMLQNYSMGLLEAYPPEGDSGAWQNGMTSKLSFSRRPSSSSSSVAVKELEILESGRKEYLTNQTSTQFSLNSASSASNSAELNPPLAYSDFYQCKWHVQFLHQTAKEYLSEPNILIGAYQDRLSRDRLQHRGPLLILNFWREWLQVESTIQHAGIKALGYKAPNDILKYAPALYTRNTSPSIDLLNRKVSQETELLHDIDHLMSARGANGRFWVYFSQEMHGKHVSFIKFLAYAITRDMRDFVAETLNNDPSLLSSTDNERRSLVNYAVDGQWIDVQGAWGHGSHPQLLEDLIIRGASIHGSPKRMTGPRAPSAMEFLRLCNDNPWMFSEYAAIECIELLLENGADPNSRSWYWSLADPPNMEEYSEDIAYNWISAPILHLVATMRMPKVDRFRAIKVFLDHGADPKGRDMKGRSLLEYVYRIKAYRNDLPSKDELLLLLQYRARITRKMKNNYEDFPNFPWYNPEIDRQEYMEGTFDSLKDIFRTILPRK
jgi:hypothetical protein